MKYFYFMEINFLKCPKVTEQCDYIGQNLAVWLLLFEHFLHFQLNKKFQNKVCCTCFNIQKELGVNVLNFQHFGYSFGFISILLGGVLFRFMVALLLRKVLYLKILLFKKESLKMAAFQALNDALLKNLMTFSPCFKPFFFTNGTRKSQSVFAFKILIRSPGTN